MTLFAALQAGVGRAIPTTPWDMVVQASTVTQAVLVLLVFLSLTSWGIMLAKWWEFRRLRRASRVFLKDFERVSRSEQVVGITKRVPASPFTRIFARAWRFITEGSAGAPEERVLKTGTPLSASQVEALRLVLDAETNSERDQLGRFIPWLATIGSVSPLIGLLGTVLGVIKSFLGLATQGSGNIGAVAPGIAEALIATAAALSVAIPAVFGYNIFANRLNRIDGELEGFGSEVIALMVREGRV